MNQENAYRVWWWLLLPIGLSCILVSTSAFEPDTFVGGVVLVLFAIIFIAVCVYIGIKSGQSLSGKIGLSIVAFIIAFCIGLVVCLAIFFARCSGSLGF